jgi:hypothetical protein
MKKLFILLTFIFLSQNLHSQLRYGISGGLNVSGGILPDLTLNTDINDILNGEDVVQGTPQLADFTGLYKMGVFARWDGKIGSAKIGVNYTATNIKKKLDLNLFTTNILDLKMNYVDIDFSYALNITSSIYWTLGYTPSFLISDDDTSSKIQTFDSRVFTGFGLKIGNGATVDINAVVGIDEVIEGSYIHHLMIPVTISIPLN